jgi:hypothetical protein
MTNDPGKPATCCGARLTCMMRHAANCQYETALRSALSDLGPADEVDPEEVDRVKLALINAALARQTPWSRIAESVDEPSEQAALNLYRQLVRRHACSRR